MSVLCNNQDADKTNVHMTQSGLWLYVPVSEDLSPQSPDSVLGLVGNDGSKSDFGRVEGTSPLCLEKKRGGGGVEDLNVVIFTENPHHQSP